MPEEPQIQVYRLVLRRRNFKKQLALTSRTRHFHFYLPTAALLADGAPKLSLETTAVEFFPENAIPPLSLPRVTPTEIQHMFDHYRHLEWPTSFN